MAVNDEVRCALIFEAGGVSMANIVYFRDTNSAENELNTLTLANQAGTDLVTTLLPAMSQEYSYTCVSSRIIAPTSTPNLVAFVDLPGAQIDDGHPTTQVAIMRYYDEEYFSTKKTYHLKLPTGGEQTSFGGRMSNAQLATYSDFTALIVGGISTGAIQWDVIAPTPTIPLSPDRPRINKANVNPVLKKFRGRQTRLCA